jgi:hypothetical protein
MQADVDASYDKLRCEFVEDLLKGEMPTAPLQQPFRSLVRMTQALERERDAASAQIEAEENDASRYFNIEAEANLLDLLIHSSGGQRLVSDIQSNIGRLRQAVEPIQEAADGAPLEAALQSLADRVTSSEQFGNLLSRLDGVSAPASSDMDGNWVRFAWFAG